MCPTVSTPLQYPDLYSYPDHIPKVTSLRHLIITVGPTIKLEKLRWSNRKGTQFDVGNRFRHNTGALDEHLTEVYRLWISQTNPCQYDSFRCNFKRYCLRARMSLLSGFRGFSRLLSVYEIHAYEVRPHPRATERQVTNEANDS